MAQKSLAQKSLAQKSLAQKSLAMAIALRVALATALVCTVVFVLVYAVLQHQSRAALQATIDTDIAGLSDIYRVEGPDGLSQRLRERLDLAPTAGERPVYIVVDAQGRALVGDATQWPKLDTAVSEAGITKAGDETILARVTQLRGGVKIMAGRSMALAEQSLSQTRLLFLAALVLIVGGAFFIGEFGARKLRRRIGAINGVFDSLYDGDFKARTPATAGRPDELDALSGHVNLTLDRVERLLKAQRDVSDNIAHEVRTPLTALNQRLEDALARIDDPEAITSLHQAQDQVRGTLRLLDSLLDIASAEAQRGDLRALPEVDLSELARQLCELYEASAEEAGLTLTADITEGIVVRADAMQMSRLMVNLLDNALKYGAAGSALRFTLRPGPVITVEDEGQGVPDADKGRVFDRYHRAHASMAKGHGLGLALVAAIAGRHNLSVRVEDSHPDRVNKGARFIVSPEGGA
ncbi:histidine kinase-, DNA gyrase B-, and HSP90-like ATPase family protein [Asticcacaulis biprosthecium C19]|uniref:histidine kinase n=1 Tax=Asticcacaulis biprosthecium C19 TaxID=715226 RepID=F4QGF0_9CAUL|nr:histidine kinase-, DNA gyrase B-, and HSP90-like ATPase family protein [Asticcacaulis biprosthecium C19]